MECCKNKGGCGIRIVKDLKEDLALVVEKEFQLTKTLYYFKKYLLLTYMSIRLKVCAAVRSLMMSLYSQNVPRDVIVQSDNSG